MKHPESQLQRACITWLRLQYPKVVAFAIPNGGKRNAREGAILKAEGVLAGVPDLFIAEPHGHYSGLFIEMKAGRGTTTEAQDAMIRRLGEAGYCVDVCRSLEDFQAVVRGYVSLPTLASMLASGNDPVQLLST